MLSVFLCLTQDYDFAADTSGAFKPYQGVAIIEANCALRALLFCIDTFLGGLFFTNNQPLIEAFTMLLSRFLKALALRSSQ
jgi:hypothetical protein